MTEYRVRQPVDTAALDELTAAAWPRPGTRAERTWELSLGWVTAHDDDRLVGFVNVAWDGEVHAFLLDPTVHPDVQHRGIGTELVRRAAELARDAGCEWLHVDYEPSTLGAFYVDACGFTPTTAALLRLRPGSG